MLVAVLTAGSCALESEEVCPACNKVRTVAVALNDELPAALETPLYQFRRATGTGDAYVLECSYVSVGDGETLKIPLTELKAYDYRFLMIARPAGSEWPELQTAGGQPFGPGDAWDDLRLVSASGAASGDVYGGFEDLSGQELLDSGSIRLTLTRIAGEMVFDFYRYDEALSKPVGVVSAEVQSVLDRVTGIEIVYENPTTALRFDADGELRPAAVASEPLRQTIAPALTDFKVVLPQADKGLAAYSADVRGSLRIEGRYLLPSASKLRVRLAFTYYDTTPLCGNDHAGDHVAGCFAQRQLMLDLPSADAPAGLPVAADCFTVNRARLRCDRIIDVPVEGFVWAKFEWL